jgi:hypothetical protein
MEKKKGSYLSVLDQNADARIMYYESRLTEPHVGDRLSRPRFSYRAGYFPASRRR